MSEKKQGYDPYEIVSRYAQKALKSLSSDTLQKFEKHELKKLVISLHELERKSGSPVYVICERNRGKIYQKCNNYVVSFKYDNIQEKELILSDIILCENEKILRPLSFSADGCGYEIMADRMKYIEIIINDSEIIVYLDKRLYEEWFNLSVEVDVRAILGEL